MTRHPDILNDAEAVGYIGLDQCFDRPEAAVARLHELARTGRIKPLTWCKKHLWARPNLDAFIVASIAELAPESATGADGKPR